MYQRSKVKSDEIKKLHDEGVMLTKICEITSSSQQTVKNVLSYFGIDYDLLRKQEYQTRLEKVIELYNQGKSQSFIEKELGLTRKTIRTLLKSKNLKYRDKSEQHHIRYGTEINHDCFDILTPEALYWIGILHADGHIEEKTECSVELVLHNTDMNHLERFRQFLGTSREIKPDNGNCSRVRINSRKIRDRLMELGFTHDKSYTAKPHDLLKGSRDFWRGEVDGDGGVYNYSYSKQMTLCGTLETIFEFVIFCEREAKVKYKYPSKANGEGLYQVHYYSEDAKKILNVLYKDATIYLDRKFEKYQELINEPEIEKTVDLYNLPNMPEYQ